MQNKILDEPPTDVTDVSDVTDVTDVAIFPRVISSVRQRFSRNASRLFGDAPWLLYGGCGQPAVPLQDKSQQGMPGQAMMASVLEAWAANDDASQLPFDAKITRRYADDLGEVIVVDLLGEKTVLPIFRNERCPIILQILNSSMTNRNADQVGRILAREKHCVPLLSAAGLLVQSAAHAGCAIVRKMLQAGFDPEHTSFHDEHLVVTAMAAAAFESRTDVMAVLMEAGASIHSNSVPPIAMAVRGGSPATAAWLLERGARPDGNRHSKRHAYANPLACAIRMSSFESARLLMEAGAMTHWRYENGESFTAVFSILYGFHMRGALSAAA